MCPRQQPMIPPTPGDSFQTLYGCQIRWELYWTYGNFLTPDSAFLGTSLPLMPLIMSKSKPVKEDVNFIASSLSLRAGTLSTKTFPNYDSAALSATDSSNRRWEARLTPKELLCRASRFSWVRDLSPLPRTGLLYMTSGLDEGFDVYFSPNLVFLGSVFASRSDCVSGFGKDSVTFAVRCRPLLTTSLMVS